MTIEYKYVGADPLSVAWPKIALRRDDTGASEEANCLELKYNMGFLSFVWIVQEVL